MFLSQFRTFIQIEKEPEPIPNFLKQKRQQDEEITKFERLRERMNQAMKAAEKGRHQIHHPLTVFNWFLIVFCNFSFQ